jgi:hemolysin III
MEAIGRAPAELRLARKEAIRAKNEPPLLSLGEEVINAVSHGVGTCLSIAAFVLLLLRSDTPLKLTASCFYGISMIVMMLCSCVYHAMPAGSAVKRICRRLDYSSIYLLIGGTFAPVLLIYLGNVLGITFFCVQWGVILLGVTLVAVFGPGKWRPLHFTLYFLIGWSGLAFLPSLYQNNRPLLLLIFLGGLAYTLGMIPFARKKKYNHCIWHFFVLAGALFHWAGIYTMLY